MGIFPKKKWINVRSSCKKKTVTNVHKLFYILIAAFQRKQDRQSACCGDGFWIGRTEAGIIIFSVV